MNALYCPDLPLEPPVSREDPVCHCDECLEPLFEGHEVYDYDGHIVCELCEETYHRQYKRVLSA